MLWGPRSTTRWRRPRQGQGRRISTRQPVPARLDGGKSVPATWLRQSATMDEPTGCASPKDQGADQSPPCKRQPNFSKSDLPGMRRPNVQLARTCQILRQHRLFHNLLEQRPQGMWLVQMPPKAHWRPCPTQGTHGWLCRGGLRQTRKGSNLPNPQPSKPI